MKKAIISSGTTLFMLAVLSNIFMQLIASVIVSVCGVSLLDSATFNFLLSFALSIVVFSLYLVYRHGKGGIKLQNIVYRTKPTLPLILSGAIISVVVVLGFYSFAEMGATILKSFGYVSSMAGMETSVLDIVIFFVYTVIFAPIAEECVYRGALLESLDDKMNIYLKCLISGGAFALMHMNPEQTIYQFILGFILAYVTIRSGSLLPAIVAHFGNNLIAFLISFEGINGWIKSIFSGNIFLVVSVCALLCVGSVVAIYFITKRITVVKAVKAPKATINRVVEGGEDKVDKLASELDKIERKQATFTQWVPYFVGLFICLFMWITLFIQSIS